MFRAEKISNLDVRHLLIVGTSLIALSSAVRAQTANKGAAFLNVRNGAGLDVLTAITRIRCRLDAARPVVTINCRAALRAAVFSDSGRSPRMGRTAGVGRS
jgi:hypothetical protein